KKLLPEYFQLVAQPFSDRIKGILFKFMGGKLVKLVSWNVNGLRACVKKGFNEFFENIDADIFCVQEIKLQEGQIDLFFDEYESYWNYAERKGYSGTAVSSKKTPLNVYYGVGEDKTQSEGRILTLEFDDFFLVNVYTPNSQRDLASLSYRLEWEDKLYDYLLELDQIKPVIYCGDLNVAHKPIDLKNDKTSKGNSGFTEEEREKIRRLLNQVFTDTLPYFAPDTEGLYTWSSYMKTVRERTIGWRIDYFIV